jgi:hypothetical protein
LAFTAGVVVFEALAAGAFAVAAMGLATGAAFAFPTDAGLAAFAPFAGTAAGFVVLAICSSQNSGRSRSPAGRAPGAIDRVPPKDKGRLMVLCIATASGVASLALRRAGRIPSNSPQSPDFSSLTLFRTARQATKWRRSALTKGKSNWEFQWPGNDGYMPVYPAL